MHPNKNSIISGDFNEKETQALISGMQLAYAMKLIRKNQFDYEDVWDTLKTLPDNHSTFSLRLNSDLEKKWTLETSLFERKAKEQAENYWKEKWHKENSKSADTNGNIVCLSDSQRSKLRFKPRLGNRCKCGSKDHERVNHPHCVLYRNLKQQIIHQIGEEKFTETILNKCFATETQKINTKTKEKSALVLERFQNSRAKRMKLEHEDDEKEAFFVESMEQFQVKNGMAIFAPTHLSIMVISAVAELTKQICVSRPENQNVTKNIYIHYISVILLLGAKTFMNSIQ